MAVRIDSFESTFLNFLSWRSTIYFISNYVKTNSSGRYDTLYKWLMTTQIAIKCNDVM